MSKQKPRGKEDKKAAEEHLTTETQTTTTEDLARDPRTGGDILVEIMRQAGVDVAFGVISIHNLPLVEAVARDLRFVPVRHEAAAINAADGYARATGGIGVAITSTGTGAGNAAGSMLEALNAQSRVLHITGNVNADLIGEGKGAYHEVPRQLAMLQAVSHEAMRIETARQSRKVLSDALRMLNTPPFGPVSVDWPINLQYTADPEQQNKVPERKPQVRTGARRDLERAAAVMAEAQRPLIWAGGGARTVGPALTELAERWGAGVLTGANGRGSVPEDHPLCIGNFPTHEALDELLRDADCLLTVGSHLRGNETREFELPLPANHIQIDLDPEALGRNFPIEVGLQADAASAVPALLAELGEHAVDEEWAQRVAEVAATARKDLRKQIGAYAEICDSMRKRLPKGSPIVRDVTIPGSSWGNRLLPIFEPTSNVHAAGGGIGQGLAMAVGAGVARPEVPTLAIVGDGGLAVHLGELAVLANEQPHVVLVIFNDGGYGVLRNLQKARGEKKRGVDLLTPDFGLLAESFGLKHKRVESADDFDQALKKAVKRGGPTVIEVAVKKLRPKPQAMIPAISVPNA
ncbi:thiamine pyrophosphate-binding protein [Tessaracoccus massiliensis]|uniref:thiamine pyrophosphate-binding protein n=1 Tax=Tessaracoccus massiliensis TaxID=1522311 RepID=UPI0009E627C6|nr:thiamine pyrophosphate-binding protein [Tessaracoccus massiliensis]